MPATGRCFPLRAFLIDELCFDQPFTAIKLEDEKKIHGERYVYYATEVNQTKVIKKVVELAKVWGFQIEEEDEE